MKHKLFVIGILILAISLVLGACSVADTDSNSAQSAPDYSFTLTPEQVQNYQSAVSYLLKRDGNNIYRVQYSNCGVTLADGKLTTLYNGMAIELLCPNIEQCFPVLDLNGMQGDLLNCIGTATLQRPDDPESGTRGEMSSWRCLLQVDPSQGKSTLLGMLPRAESTNEQLLAGEYGALEDFSIYEQLTFYDGTYYHAVYGDDQTPLPISDWKKTDIASITPFYLANPIELNYVPLTGGDYYIFYEVTDKQGNIYCSQLIPYQTEPALEEAVKSPDFSVKWEKGQRQQLIFEENDIQIYLSVEKSTSGDSFYAIKVKNDSEYQVYVHAEDVLINEKVSCDTISYITVDPGKFVADASGFLLGVADSSAELKTIDSLQFSLFARDNPSNKILIEEKTVRLDMTDAWPIDQRFADYYTLTTPAMGATAREQLLLENQQVRLSLINAGARGNYDDAMVFVYKFENLTQIPQTVFVSGYVVNNVYIPESCKLSVPGNCICYAYATLRINQANGSPNTSIETLSILVETPGPEDWYYPSYTQYWVPVVLSQSATASEFDAGQLIWEHEGIQIGLRGYDNILKKWIFTMQNTTSQSVSLSAINATDGEDLWINAKAGAGQNTVFSLRSYEDISLYFLVYDFNQEILLAEGTEEIVLQIPVE